MARSFYQIPTVPAQRTSAATGTFKAEREAYEAFRALPGFLVYDDPLPSRDAALPELTPTPMAVQSQRALLNVTLVKFASPPEEVGFALRRLLGLQAKLSDVYGRWQERRGYRSHGTDQQARLLVPDILRWRAEAEALRWHIFGFYQQGRYEPGGIFERLRQPTYMPGRARFYPAVPKLDPLRKHRSEARVRLNFTADPEHSPGFSAGIIRFALKQAGAQILDFGLLPGDDGEPFTVWVEVLLRTPSDFVSRFEAQPSSEDLAWLDWLTETEKSPSPPRGKTASFSPLTYLEVLDFLKDLFVHPEDRDRYVRPGEHTVLGEYQVISPDEIRLPLHTGRQGTKQPNGAYLTIRRGVDGRLGLLRSHETGTSGEARPEGSVLSWEEAAEYMSEALGEPEFAARYLGPGEKLRIGAHRQVNASTHWFPIEHIESGERARPAGALEVQRSAAGRIVWRRVKA